MLTATTHNENWKHLSNHPRGESLYRKCSLATFSLLRHRSLLPQLPDRPSHLKVLWRSGPIVGVIFRRAAFFPSSFRSSGRVPFYFCFREFARRVGRGEGRGRRVEFQPERGRAQHFFAPHFFLRALLSR